MDRWMDRKMDGWNDRWMEDGRERDARTSRGRPVGTHNYPSPAAARSRAHSAANLCPRPTTQLQARTRRAAWCAATRRRGGYCTTRWSRCSYTTSASIHATGRVRRGKVLRRGTGGAVGQQGPLQGCLRPRTIATAFLIGLNASVRDGCRTDHVIVLFW